MPRKATPSAISPLALQSPPAAAPRLASGLMGEAGSRDALAQLSKAMAELKALAIQPMLQQAVQALQAEDHQKGAEWAIKALERDERNGFGWYLLAIARERAGDFGSSVAAYETALKLLPDHAEIANDLGRLAFRMGMKAQAEKLFRHFLARFPDHPEGANNLACALRDQNFFDEAIDVLRAAILKAPDNPILWNTMGSIVADRGEIAGAPVFFEEALRLSPKFPKALYNLGHARLALGEPEAALEACEEAITLVAAEDERQMMCLCRSTILMDLGRIGEGWDQYETRRHPQYADVIHYLVDYPGWRPGDDLSGKSLLVVAEQGLGDEILFANTMPDVLDRLGPDGRLTLAVEPRLVPLFQRSFPQARVGAHRTVERAGRAWRTLPFLDGETGIDLWTPMGSLLREFRRTAEAFPERPGYMVPDAARVAHWRTVLEAAPPGPKVGLLWKSGVQTDARHRFFSPFEQWAPVLAQEGLSFVNLQYGDCSEELAFVKRELGVEIWAPPGIDLKQDVDDVAALSCAMDLVLGFSNATFNMAAACGRPTWLITAPGAWTRLGQRDRYLWYPQTRVFAPETFGDWPGVMAEVAEALGGFAAGAER